MLTLCLDYIWIKSWFILVLLCCITYSTVFVDSDLLPLLCIHHCFITLMAELLEIKLETRIGGVVIKHFSLLWWIQVMGPTVLVGCLQAAIRILFKYNFG